MSHCRICFNHLGESDDNLVLCDHKKGFVHLGCCKNDCSHHGAPCDHALSKYEKIHNTAELFNWLG